MKRSTEHQGTIVSYGFFIRDIVQIPVVKQHQSYNADFDSQIVHPDSGVVLFPLVDSSSNLIGIVEIVLKLNERHLFNEHIQIIKIFMSKFKAFSKWILSYKLDDSVINEFQQLLDTEQFLNATQSRLHRLFRAETIEIWMFDRETEEMSKFGLVETKIAKENWGYVGHSVKSMQLSHTRNVKAERSYNPSTDGTVAESVLVQPMESPTDNCIYAIALRGNMRDEIFMHRDEVLLKKVLKYIIISFQNSAKYNNTRQKNIDPVSAMVSSLPQYKVSKKSEKFLSSLMDTLKVTLRCERVLYFTVDNVAREVRSLYVTGSEPPITYQFGSMHAGKCAETGDIINCSDAALDRDADTSLDQAMQRVTKSILTVPIISVDGQISAVIQVINREDCEPFSKSDAETVTVYGTICICLMNNARLLVGNQTMKEYIEYSNELIKILSLSETKQNTEVNKLFRELCKKAVKSETCTVYLYDKVTDSLYDYENSCFEAPCRKGPVEDCMKRVSAVYLNDCQKAQPYLVEQGIKRICCAPLVNAKRTPIGVVVCTNGTIYTDTESDVLKHFVDLYSFAIQRQLADEKIELGPLKSGIENVIGVTERKLFITPKTLTPSNELISQLTSNRFKVFGIDDNMKKCLIFSFFDGLGVMSALQITAETLFGFTNQFTAMFNPVPFHNSEHALDSAQFLVQMIARGNLKQVLTPVEIHALLAAIFCASMKHDGTSDAYNVAADTVQFRLYGEHVQATRARSILARCYTENGLLSTLSESDLDTFWRVTTTLLKTLDVRDIPVLESRAKEIIKSSLLDLSNTEHRLLMLELLFRCAELGFTCRPFGIASRWEDARAAECFRIGELEQKKGLVFSSPDNSSDLYIRPKSAMEILNTQTIPLFDTLILIIPEFNYCASIAKENLAAWSAELKHLRQSAQ